MASTLTLTAGALSTVAGTTAFNTADLDGLANGDGVLSSVAAFDNTTNLDLSLDASVQLLISSSTLAAGAAVYLYLAYLNEDASTYGDGAFAGGTPLAKTPGLQPFAVISPTITGSAQTVITGTGNVPLLRRKFKLLLFNQLGFALATSPGNVYIDTTNIQGS